ncbi:hypothetical protein CA13_09040 [Planctomycetes bacterium CA13]|uniref:Uncharacterized protein n=1 Tax=Novipirellula herctigrandis TaxID=2527986 RepID=A0A5C5YWW4_9BACT|nr:hypothetical protein CA13_09040 [Planctomycetes bacterium CA13]
MSRIRALFIAIVTASLLTVTANSAFGILVQIGSDCRIPFTLGYPKHAVIQVVAALKSDNYRLVDGQSNMRVSTLRFRGDTTAINDMLKKLADCPVATVAVSFRAIDHTCDWQIDHSVRSNTFAVIVNLKSARIRLEELIIPSANGPKLKSETRISTEP